MREVLNVLDRKFSAARPAVRYGTVVGLTAGVIWGDVATPAYLLMTGYYLIPIAVSAWYCRFWMTVLVTLVSASVNLYMVAGTLPANATVSERLFVYPSFAIIMLAFGLLMLELKLIVQKLHLESTSDPLTGLKNRRGFLMTAEYELARADRSRETLSVALVDLDNFKQVNDTQGHKVGDALLVAVSRNMTTTLREIDLIGRLGGDEFAILLPNTDLATAEQILSRLRLGLRPLLSSFSSAASASIGVVSLAHGHGRTVEEILHRADEAMYAAKHGGKDRVITLEI